MNGRTSEFAANDSIAYRYGFNGKEKDPEGMGGGGSTYDYGFRIYNPKIAKFLSVDPLTKEYPWYTPYQFAGNKPIQAIDLDGLEEWIVTIKYDDNKEPKVEIINANEVENEIFVAQVWNKFNKAIDIKDGFWVFGGNEYTSKAKRPTEGVLTVDFTKDDFPIISYESGKTYRYVETSSEVIGEYSGEITFGLQAGVNLGKFATLEAKALSLTLADAKYNTIDGYEGYSYSESKPKLSSGINGYIFMTGGGIGFNSNKNKDGSYDRKVKYSGSIFGVSSNYSKDLSDFGVKKSFTGIDFGIGASLFLGIGGNMKTGIETTEEFKKVDK